MFNQYSKLKITPGQWLKFLPTTSFLKTQSLQTFFKRDLPQNFEELHIPVYIGATNMNTAELMVFHKGELLSPLLGSIAIPGIFPSVKYQKHLLNDGGIVDNFPTQLAQTTYPNHKIIGVALNKFRENKNPTNLISTFLTAYAIVMRKDLVKKSKEIEVAFYEDIDC
ncbi:MAG: patatin-like phospholipase family protein [Candidatus Peribacteria bacterium]|jgi:NTE family protein|nr:patatin-like phospholipase family protein [Candidatus Peribacteria bacterium]